MVRQIQYQITVTFSSSSVALRTVPSSLGFFDLRFDCSLDVAIEASMLPIKLCTSWTALRCGISSSLQRTPHLGEVTGSGHVCVPITFGNSAMPWKFVIMSFLYYSCGLILDYKSCNHLVVFLCLLFHNNKVADQILMCYMWRLSIPDFRTEPIVFVGTLSGVI